MIIQEVFWDETKILTIIHEKMDDDEFSKERNLNENININDHIISFKEYYSDENCLENFEYEFKIEGFLECQNHKNPYSTYSTFYKEFVNQDDNLLVSNNEIQINQNDFEELIEFIKKYTNLAISPYSIGNIFIFSPIKINVNSHNSKNFPYLIINGIDTKGIAFVKFKLDNIILESYVINDISDGYEIYSEGDWNNYEIEIFDEEKLVFKAKYNISRSISFDMNYLTKVFEKKLLKIDGKIMITDGEISDSFIISDNTYLDFLNHYLLNEKIEFNKIYHPKKSYCNFLKTDEIRRAYKIFEDIIKQNQEMWIFDPFFISDNNSVDKLIDILILLSSTPKKKHIIFTEAPDENEEKNMTFEKYERQVFTNGYEELRDLKLENLIFHKSDEKFHDRFIFLKNEEKIWGYQVGTSLNSFGTNYSNIIKLNDYCAEQIFDILSEDIITDEIYKLGD